MFLKFAGVMCLVIWSVVLSATTYYVAPPPAGNDSNNGSSGSPFATIQKGADVAAAGDTVLIAAGTYIGAKFYISGTSGSPITFHAQPGVIVNQPGSLNTNFDNLWIRDASYITLEGFESTAAPRSGIAVQGEPAPDEVHGIVLQNNNCHDNGRWGIFTGYAEGIQILNNETSYSTAEHGIYVSNSADNPVIRGNISHHNHNAGIQINADPALPGDKIISNAVIDSNIIYENGTGGAAAINLASVTDSLIVNNLMYNNHASGIAGWDDGDGNQWGTHNNRFYHNTILQAANGRAVVTLLDGSHDNELKNNILLHLGSKPSINVDASSGTGLDSDYNIVINLFSPNDNDFISLVDWQALGHDTHSFISTPAALFVDYTNADFHLANGSPAIDAGTTLSAVSDDLEGTVRPQSSAYDIGAYEYLVTCDGDTTDPTTNITAPTGGTVSGTVNITANAEDDCYVSKVECYVDGNLIGTDTVAPYSFNWNSLNTPNGSHDLTTIAYDTSGHSTTSPAISVDVNNAYLFYDDFNDNSTAGWSNIAWSEANGDYIGTTSKKTTTVSSTFTGAGACTIEADLFVVTTKGRASLLAWYKSGKTYVELSLQDDMNRLQLIQNVGGKIYKKQSYATSISPGINYHVKVVYTGSSFQVLLNGSPVITMSSAKAAFGNVGFRVKSTTGASTSGRFGSILVY